MVGATAVHLQCLRRLVDDDGWIRTLREEAENECTRLMTPVRIARPEALEWLLIALARWIFYVGFGRCLSVCGTTSTHPCSGPSGLCWTS